MTIPREMTAGDSVSFDVRIADYPAPDWQLFYTLFNATEVITLTSAADDEDHAFTVAASVTANWTPGRYDWTAYATGPDDARVTLTTGSAIIRVNPAALTATDGRSHARRMLEALEATLEGTATAEQLDTLRAKHGDRDWQRDTAKLIELRDLYRREVRAEDQAEAMARGDQVSTSLKVRFR